MVSHHLYFLEFHGDMARYIGKCFSPTDRNEKTTEKRMRESRYTSVRAKRTNAGNVENKRK